MAWLTRLSLLPRLMRRVRLLGLTLGLLRLRLRLGLCRLRRLDLL